MRRSLQLAITVATALAIASLSAAPVSSEEPAAGVKLFDGRTLDGWDGSADWFRIPRNEFLSTVKEYGDFELRLKFKLLGKGANAGVQLRSRRIPDHHEMRGYQADLGEGWWGCLYDESRRNRVLAGPDKAELAKVLKLDDWNDYRIRCEGRHIQLWINGLQTVDYTEPDEKLEQRGLIAVQIHGGPPSEAWYKDLVIEELP
jgi:hypothetical protein